MPLASDPTMWKSVGSPQRACVFVTSTGIPLAAQTLLKFTPAAITKQLMDDYTAEVQPKGKAVAA